MGISISYFRNLSVTWKFILAYFAILIVPIIFMGIFLYDQTLSSAIAQAQLVMEQNLAQTKDSILQKIKIIENISQIIILTIKFKLF